MNETDITFEAADQRINKMEIKYQGRFITHHNSGNDKKDFNNRFENRRNYNNKYKKADDIIILNRNKGRKNGLLWNKNYISSRNQDPNIKTTTEKINISYLIKNSYNKINHIKYLKQYNKQQETRANNLKKKELHITEHTINNNDNLNIYKNKNKNTITNNKKKNIINSIKNINERDINTPLITIHDREDIITIWECKFCTFANIIKGLVCEVCGEKRSITNNTIIEDEDIDIDIMDDNEVIIDLNFDKETLQ